MPTYTIEDTKTNKTYDVNVKWKELQELLVQHPHLRKVITAPNIIGGVGGFKTDSGWKDLLKTVKKGSGAGNTIDI